MAIFQLEPLYDDIKMSPPEKPLQHHHGVYHPFFRSLGRDKVESELGAGCKGEAKVDVFGHSVVQKKSLGGPQCFAVICVAFRSFVKFGGVSLSKNLTVQSCDEFIFGSVLF